LEVLGTITGKKGVLLVGLDGFSWEVGDFGGDEKRREWHERKMESKVVRAEIQLNLVRRDGRVGEVDHILPPHV